MADAIALNTAKDEYPQLFEALSSSAIIVLVSVAVVVVIVIVFATARLYIAYTKANNAKAVAEQEAVALREANLKFKEELQTHNLDKDQVEMIKDRALDVDSKLPKHLKLDWKVLKL